MNRERYLSIFQWVEAKPIRKKLLIALNKTLPFVLGGMYVISLLLCFMIYPVLLLRLVLRPAVCFLLITVIRNLLKAPRPYDVHDFMPLCGYHPGKNKSFPSRHTGSAAIIALEIWHLWTIPGVIAIILAMIMAIVRVVCGNHFIKDVFVAFLIAIIINSL